MGDLVVFHQTLSDSPLLFTNRRTLSAAYLQYSVLEIKSFQIGCNGSLSIPARRLFHPQHPSVLLVSLSHGACPLGAPFIYSLLAALPAGQSCEPRGRHSRCQQPSDIALQTFRGLGAQSYHRSSCRDMI